MQQILIPIGIMVGLSILSWLVQQMKTASDKRQVQKDRERQRAVAVERAEKREDRPERERPMLPPPAPAMRTGGTRSRSLHAGDQPPARKSRGTPGRPRPPRSTVATGQGDPDRRSGSQKTTPLRTDRPGNVPRHDGSDCHGSIAGSATARDSVEGRGDELPMAAVVGAPRIVSVPSAAPVSPPVVTVAVKAKSAMVERKVGPGSPMGVQLMSLLKDKNSMAIAVLLQEVLGPPKCKRGS